MLKFSTRSGAKRLQQDRRRVVMKPGLIGGAVFLALASADVPAAAGAPTAQADSTAARTPAALASQDAAARVAAVHDAVLADLTPHDVAIRTYLGLGLPKFRPNDRARLDSDASWAREHRAALAAIDPATLDPQQRLTQAFLDRMLATIEEDADEAIALGWTGPDLFTSGRADISAGIKIYEYFLKHGVVFTPWSAGPGSRKAKMAAFFERLYYEKDDDGAFRVNPGIVFIEEECPHAIRTIPALEYDPNLGGEDVQTDMEDHAYDSISGFCLMRPWKPKRPVEGLSAMFPKRADGDRHTWLSR
jgi:hypothetical protein